MNIPAITNLTDDQIRLVKKLYKLLLTNEVKNNFNYKYIALTEEGGCRLTFAEEKHLIPNNFTIDLLCSNGSFALFMNLDNYLNCNLDDVTYDLFVNAFEHCYGKYLKMGKENTPTIKVRNNNDGTVTVIQENVMKFEDFLEYLNHRDIDSTTVKWV